MEYYEFMEDVKRDLIFIGDLIMTANGGGQVIDVIVEEDDIRGHGEEDAGVLVEYDTDTVYVPHGEIIGLVNSGYFGDSFGGEYE